MSYAALGAAPIYHWYVVERKTRFAAPDPIGYIFATEGSARELLHAASAAHHHRHAADGTWLAWDFNCRIESMQELVSRGYMIILKNGVFKAWFYGRCADMKALVHWINTHSHGTYQVLVCTVPEPGFSRGCLV